MLSTTPITKLSISYPDFRLYEVIDPYQFNTNNADIVKKVNEVIARVNSNTTTIEEYETSKGDKSYVDSEVTKLQGQINIVFDHLKEFDHFKEANVGVITDIQGQINIVFDHLKEFDHFKEANVDVITDIQGQIGILSRHLKDILSIVDEGAFNIVAEVAENDVINDLTVNRLKTVIDRGTDSVNYIDIQDNIASWITGEKIPHSEFHAQNSKGQYLFWVDKSKKQITTKKTEFPVIAYRFNELVKLKIHFNSQDPNDIPIIEFGSGDEKGLSKGYIYKDKLGLHLKYLDKYNKEHMISMTDYGILINEEKSFTHVEYATLYESGVLHFKKAYYNKPTVLIQGGTYSFIKDGGLFIGLDVNVTGSMCNIVVFGG